MRSWVLAAGVLAAAVISPNAKAADLDEGPPPDRYGSVYDDPRYADIYRRPERPPPVVVPPPYRGPVPREHIYRDEDDDAPPYAAPRRFSGDAPPYAAPRRFSYNDPRADYGAHCVPREVVRERLTRHGWHDFIE